MSSGGHSGDGAWRTEVSWGPGARRWLGTHGSVALSGFGRQTGEQARAGKAPGQCPSVPDRRQPRLGRVGARAAGPEPALPAGSQVARLPVRAKSRAAAQTARPCGRGTPEALSWGIWGARGCVGVVSRKSSSSSKNWAIPAPH